MPRGVVGCFRQLEGVSRLTAGGLRLTAGVIQSVKVKDNCWFTSVNFGNLLY